MRSVRPVIILPALLLLSSLFSCRPSIEQRALKNAQARNHAFLEVMDADGYYAQDAVDHCRAVLVQLCWAIEQEGPEELSQLYPITHHYTRQINAVQVEFEREGSELETVAREAIAAEFEFIALAYGFDADVEEMIAPREW